MTSVSVLRSIPTSHTSDPDTRPSNTRRDGWRENMQYGKTCSHAPTVLRFLPAD